MRKAILIPTVLLLLLAGCWPSPAPAPTTTPGPTDTPAPPTPTPLPPTATPPPPGISGTVHYTGPSTGGILIFAMDHPPVANEAPSPAAISTFDDVTGTFHWDLTPGTYYVLAFFTIGRPPQGPPLPNEPTVSCQPIQLGADETVNIEVVLTDDDAGGVEKPCVPAD